MTPSSVCHLLLQKHAGKKKRVDAGNLLVVKEFGHHSHLLIYFDFSLLLLDVIQGLEGV